jgi:hypothetical protein
VFDALAARDRGQVERLAKKCGNPVMALQVYLACDKKVGSACNLL